MKTRLLSIVAAGIALSFGSVPVFAHHSFAAEFDVKQPLSLKGTVTKVEWTNPHVWIYMDVAARGILSSEVRAALDAHLNDRMLNGASDKDHYFALIERARGRFARLIGADADEIAYTKNISDGLNMIATAIPWHRGDNVVLCPDLEHPNNVYAWLNLRRYGVEVRTVPARDGHIPIDTMIEHNGRTVVDLPPALTMR